MKIKNFKSPLMCIVFSTTLLIASTFTSCQKDESIAPSGSDTSSTNKGNNIGVVIHDKPDSTAIGGTKTGTTGGTTTGTTGGTTTGTTGGGTKTGTTGGTTTGTTGGGTKTGTTGGGTTGTTTGGGTKTGTTGGGTTGTTTGGGTKTGTTGGGTTGTTTGGGTKTGTTGGGTKTGTTGGTTTGTTTGGGTKTGTTGGATTGTTTGGGTKTGTTGGTTTGTGTTAGGGGTTTGTTSSSGQTYVASGPVTLKSNTTVSGLVIDLSNAYTIGISGSGVSNVHITNCKIINTTSDAIFLNNCSNITIDNCFISNVAFGVNALSSTTVKVNNNQFLNINGNDAKGVFGHAVQYNGVSGGGNQINGNHVENIAGVAQNPHDQLSLYKSNGLPGDSIQVNNNWIRGGQYANMGLGGAVGIGLGDTGGSYQVARGNILVNPGFIGMEAAGGNHIKIDHNLIYSSQTPVSGAGLFWANYSGTSSTDVTYAYNQVKWITSSGSELDYNSNGNSNGSSIILISNTLAASLSASILPATIITMK